MQNAQKEYSSSRFLQPTLPLAAIKYDLLLPSDTVTSTAGACTSPSSSADAVSKACPWHGDRELTEFGN